MEEEELKKAHSQLHNKIWNCECSPIKDGKYCSNCENAVVEFMNSYGTGCLTNGPLISDMRSRVSQLERENKGLTQKLESKTRRVEELKQELEKIKNEKVHKL